MFNINFVNILPIVNFVQMFHMIFANIFQIVDFVLTFNISLYSVCVAYDAEVIAAIILHFEFFMDTFEMAPPFTVVTQYPRGLSTAVQFCNCSGRQHNSIQRKAFAREKQFTCIQQLDRIHIDNFSSMSLSNDNS